MGNIRKKSWIALAGLGVVFVAILGRLYYLVQKQPADVASTQSRWAVTVANTRGTIYDCHRIPLVNDTKEYRAALLPDAALLNKVYSATAPADFAALREKLQTGAPATVKLTKPIGISDGIRLFYVPVRYGARLLTPHVIGYLDAEGSHGVTGIEASCDSLLNEYAGTASVTFAVDGSGTCLNGIPPAVTNTLSRSAGGVMLTIDRDIQQAVEDLAPDYLPKGAVIVMDPYTGAIRAMASFPSYQPSTVADVISDGDGALVNRALALFDCGSVFKTVTASAALEAGMSVDSIFTCPGGLDVSGTVFHCHNRLGHQRMTMKEAYAQSCNLYFIQLAEQIGGGTLHAMADNFGFGQAITLTDSLKTPQAVLPTAEELALSPAALANFSFGQGRLMASPLHIARMICAVVNNGVMPMPYLIEATVSEDGSITESERVLGSTLITPAAATTLRSMMESVITDGTGKRAAPTLCHAAGKTGTAETGQIGGEESVVQSWFAGYFPAENPRYVITVLAEDANNTGGQSAAYFSALADALYTMKLPSAETP